MVLTSWISESPSTIPANASHRIGIGAFVLNKSREVTNIIWFYMSPVHHV